MRISNFRDLVQIKNLTVMHHVLNEQKNVEWFGITALCAGDLVSYTNLLFYSRTGEISYPQVYTPIIANSITFYDNCIVWSQFLAAKYSQKSWIKWNP